MSVMIEGMDKPDACISADGAYYGDCPMDRVWCAQRFAPENMTMGQATEERTGKLPDWCPLVPIRYKGYGEWEVEEDA